MGGLGSNIIAILANLCIAAYLVVSHRVYLLLTVLSSVLVLSLFFYRRCGIYVGSKASHRLSRRSVDPIVHYGV